jgi:DNA-directed RNA polymerase subunit K/omega
MADEDYDFDAIEEEEEFDELEEDELEEEVVRERGRELTGLERRTLPKMTLYEATALIGVRAKMLATGAPSHPRARGSDHIRIATHEFILRVIPLKIRRTHVNGDYEIWRLNEFEIFPEILDI